MLMNCIVLCGTACQRCIRGRCTVDGVPCGENPLSEFRAMAYLSRPGHPYVCKLMAVFQTAEYLIAVMELLGGSGKLAT